MFFGRMIDSLMFGLCYKQINIFNNLIKGETARRTPANISDIITPYSKISLKSLIKSQSPIIITKTQFFDNYNHKQIDSGNLNDFFDSETYRWRKFWYSCTC